MDSFWIDWACPCIKKIVALPRDPIEMHQEIAYDVNTLIMYFVAIIAMGVFGSLLVSWIDGKLDGVLKSYDRQKEVKYFNSNWELWVKNY